MRSNYLAAGLIFNTAYDDNVHGRQRQHSSWRLYLHNFAYDYRSTRTTPRQQLALTYSPGFTFYQHTSTLNTANQNAAVNFQYRLSQHTTISLSDSFQKSSNAFDQLYPAYGRGISGSSQTPPVAVVAPYADSSTIRQMLD